MVLPVCPSITVPINLDKCLTTIWDALKHLSSPKPRIEELKTSIKRLQARADDVKDDINEVERKGQIRSHEIAQWLKDVGDLKSKAAKAEVDFGRSRCLDGWSWNCISVNRRVAKMLKDSDKLMNTSKSVPVVGTSLPQPVVEIAPSNCINSTPAMKTYKSEILGYIASLNAAEVIGIYGMGGVGKTTLLTNINNHLYDLWRNSEDKESVLGFDYVIYVEVSKDWTENKLQMDIAKRVWLTLEDDSVKKRAEKLFNFLKNKNCLLFLDDQWEYLELKNLGMDSGQTEQQKRKVVVFTTRDETVCRRMKATRKIEIKCLEPEQALDLFRRNVGEDIINSDAGINQFAEQIAKECGGLPRALVTVGKAMRTKRTYEEWDNALTLIKQSQMLKVTGEMEEEEDGIFSVLKRSYDSLEDNTRGCLLSCALWPENHSITIDELTECWIGLGLINNVDMIQAYAEGHTHIETLKAASLLKPGDNEQSTVKMHDVIRDMVLWMASSCGMNMFNWIVRVRDVASQALEEEAWHEAKRVSLMYNNIISLPSELSTCLELSVLMLQHYILEEVRGSLIQPMCVLTYLDLEDSGIRQIPIEIGQLRELRHLNLGYNPITELPAELGGLPKLTYLLLRNTSDLTTIAKGAISNLSSLKLLDLRGSRYNDCGDELKRFTGCRKYIGINITTEAGLQRLSSLQHVLTWQLCVERFMDSTNLNQLLDDIIRSRNIRQSLQRLRIENIGMNELRNTEASKLGFGYLKYLQLSQLCLLEEIKWQGLLFPHLRELSIDKCDKLRNVNWAMQLTVLRGLEISNCETMEEIISDEGNSGSEFRISKMKLSCMSKLKRISSRQLYYPYLEELEVLDCPLLRKLPFANEISSRNRLKVIQCEQTWWDNWEEVNIKDSLLPLRKLVNEE